MSPQLIPQLMASLMSAKRIKLDIQSTTTTTKKFITVVSEDNISTIGELKTLIADKLAINWPFDVILQDIPLDDFLPISTIEYNEEVVIREAIGYVADNR